MPQIESGIGDGSKQTIGPIFKESRTAPRPLDYGAGGHYRIARRLVPASTTLAGILWTFRNPTASGLVMVIEQLRLRVVQVAAPTAAIEDRFNVKHARAYTVADTTGSASIAPAANMHDVRSDMANATAQVREANIAAGASGGTKTLDTDAFANGSLWVAAALASGLGNGPVEIFDYRPDLASGEHPVLYEPDEGFCVSNENNFGATSGIVLLLDLAWMETSEARWSA